ncbi:hypothetical protein PV648_05290 [Streptomyces sp. ID05-47C]|nr:hypothetical protein [Streptomyces sp. ID05-47C]MDX3568732.1 hypothetical protein [Streptomyces sp. ID05-47C]
MSGNLRRPQRYNRRLQRVLCTSALFSIRRCEESRRFYDGQNDGPRGLGGLCHTSPTPGVRTARQGEGGPRTRGTAGPAPVPAHRMFDRPGSLRDQADRVLSVWARAPTVDAGAGLQLLRSTRGRGRQLLRSLSTQNSLPSGSASVTQLTSP